MAALRSCLTNTDGDFVVVAHASVMQAILAFVTGTPPAESRHFRLPYGGHAVLLEHGALILESYGQLPSPPMDTALAETLLAAAAPGEMITAHCRAVAAEAARIADVLPVSVDRDALLSAALLHDIARSEAQHASVGADWLQALGYGNISQLILQHHDLPEGASLEAEILYISDKCVLEDGIVSLEERFRRSAMRCRDEAAKAMHEKRLAAALAVRQHLNTLCGTEIIP